jgi:2-C-methyl-D-erythritol 4-phosphate cytidylyltransferase
MFSLSQDLFAIIVAGGSGSRMKSETPKQFIPLGNKPVLMLTVSRFLNLSREVQIILVLPAHEIQTWDNLCNTYSFDQKKIKTVAGGTSRFHSVKNGLAAIDQQDGLVAIHDGVRPFVTREMIEAGYTQAAALGNAITAVALKESIRKVGKDGSKAKNRNYYKLVQTPQTFQLRAIRSAYMQAESALFTDDAAVAEYAGQEIFLMNGAYENIKITTPEDLILAEAFLRNFHY